MAPICVAHLGALILCFLYLLITIFMPKKSSSTKARKKEPDRTSSRPNGLWIAPRSTLKGPTGERAWENRVGGTPTSSRILELADIALGLKKSHPKGHKQTEQAHDMRSKTEPYSN